MSINKNIEETMRMQAHDDYLSSITPLTDSEKKQVPNIIFILMDDMGWGDMSSFGSKSINTPHLDRMAEKGVTFQNGLSSSPVCSPSRFGCLTGRYPCRGYIKNVFFPTVDIDEKYIDIGLIVGDEIPEERIDEKLRKTIIDRIRSSYKHLNSTLPVKGILPDEITIAEVLKARGYKTGMFGKWHLGDISPHLPNDKGFEYFYGALYSNDMFPYHFWRNKEIAIEAPFDQSKITELLNAELFKFIDENSSEPFFAYYASPWPHHPVNAGESFKGSSKAGRYGDCIQEFDQGIGQLFDLLESKGILKNTFIVFTSDNGPWHQGSTGGHRGRKGNNFDGGQVVPTLCYWENQIIQGVIKEQVMNIDFFPTFCELAGVELPADRVIDGKSLLPLLKGEVKQSPHDYLMYINPWVLENPGYAVRSRDNFKYLIATNSENSVYKDIKVHPFLFDLNDDIDESYDVRMLYRDKYNELKDYLDNFNETFNQNPRGWLL